MRSHPTQAGTPQLYKNRELIFVKKTVLFFLLSTLAFSVYVLVSAARAQLTLEMSSNTPSTAQLYYDIGRGYNESDSQTVAVSSRSLDSFQELTFDLPQANIIALRFDPLTAEGSFKLRNIAVRNSDAVILRIPPSDVLAFNQIARRTQSGSELFFSTSPAPNDPGLRLRLHGQLHLNRWMLCKQLLVLGVFRLFVATILILLLRDPLRELAAVLVEIVRRVDARFQTIARRLSSPEFIEFDSHAIWFYAACFAVFFIASVANLNGSSIAIYRSVYGRGAVQKTWIGSPRGIRSDEWSYSTPDIVNQSVRLDRFEVHDSALGAHSVALAGNIPVRHFTTIFRPQYWAFFFLPVSYAFAVFWQCKALMLLTGVFTWLLLITRSGFWAFAGSLWYFFSPSIQWSYSWPTGLPEMVGLTCLITVLGCYLTIGKNKFVLVFAAVAAAGCAVNFALCAYVPHMIPLLWVAVFFFIGWCLSARALIFRREAAGVRILAATLAVCIVAIVGLLVFIDLHQALIGIANTAYPGKRVFAPGTATLSLFGSHFMQWAETEQHVPAAFLNICEASGFLWLAPATLFCFRRIRLSRMQKFALGSLWVSFCLLFAWLVLPVPAIVGSIFALNRTAAARVLPGLGLTNAGIVAVSAACMSKSEVVKQRSAGLIYYGCIALLASALMFIALRATNQNLGFFFSRSQVLLSTFYMAGLITLLASGRKLMLAAALVLPQALVFGAVNPVEQGIGVVTSSELYKFVRHNPQLLKGKWIVFSDSFADSGFFAAMGCDVYTGEHYLPDIDHFPLFAANDLDVSLLNRLGYLTAHLRKPEEKCKVELPAGVIVQWDVSPTDPVVQQVGIRYLAFVQPPPAVFASKLVPLSTKPVDGFWLYRFP